MDVFDGIPAPTDDELSEFETIAREAPALPQSELGGALHNHFRLVVPRLVREIQRQRQLSKLQSELVQLHEEKARRRQPEPERFRSYDEHVTRLLATINGRTHGPDSGGEVH